MAKVYITRDLKHIQMVDLKLLYKVKVSKIL